MKLMHLSDLHLGKRLNGFSLLEDQAHILAQILQAVDAEQPDALVVAGDIYDKPVPSAEAVQLFDDFLYSLSQRGTQTLLISGNHDSPERTAFGGRLMGRSGIHIAPVYDGAVQPVCFSDAQGEVRVYLLPFVKPANVRRFFEDAFIADYTDAVRTAVQAMQLDPAVRNVLVTHQFVAGAARCDSEELSIGGTDSVDVRVFDAFDYVALGHLHGPQRIGRDTVRYCGTPLAYSFSEENHQKSITVAELLAKDDVRLHTLPLHPLRALRTVRGSYAEVTAKAFYDGTPRADYLRMILTDEADVPDALAKLRVIYPNIMQLEYDNSRTRAGGSTGSAQRVEEKTPLALFAELYEAQNGAPFSPEQQTFCAKLMQEIWEGTV